MKNYIKKLLMLTLLSVSTLALSMEEQPEKRKREDAKGTNQEEPASKRRHVLSDQLLGDLGLPNEMWADILEHTYLNSSILDGANDIFEGIIAIKKYIQECYKKISLVCKIFKTLNISKTRWSNFKQKIREFYIPHLNQRFLEQREGQEGLYPKNAEWHQDLSINNDIAQFISTNLMLNNRLLDTLSMELIFKPKMNFNFATQNDIDIHTKSMMRLIHLLLFYGANPNTEADHEMSILSKAVISNPLHRGDYIDTVIELLLQYGANPNVQDIPEDIFERTTPLNWAIKRGLFNITKLLFKYKANPNIEDTKGKTAFDIDRECTFEFEQLVETYSKESF